MHKIKLPGIIRRIPRIPVIPVIPEISGSIPGPRVGFGFLGITLLCGGHAQLSDGLLDALDFQMSAENHLLEKQSPVKIHEEIRVGGRGDFLLC